MAMAAIYEAVLYWHLLIGVRGTLQGISASFFLHPYNSKNSILI